MEAEEVTAVWNNLLVLTDDALSKGILMIGSILSDDDDDDDEDEGEEEEGLDGPGKSCLREAFAEMRIL